MTVAIFLLFLTIVLFVGAKFAERRARYDALYTEAERGEDA